MFAFEKVNKYTSEYSELRNSINRHCSLFPSNILILPCTSSVSILVERFQNGFSIFHGLGFQCQGNSSSRSWLVTT